jgi:tetratricopeptide (TPR) repeat protein
MLDKASIIKAAQNFAAKGQVDKAIAQWEMLLKDNPDGNTYNSVGDLYLKKKSKQNAVDAFTRAATIFREEGFYLKAIAIYKKIIHVSPIDVSSRIALAELNAEKGLIGNANEHYAVAADIYIKEGATEKALGIYEEMLKLAPASINLKIKIAELYHKIGLKEEVVKEYISIASEYIEKGEYEKAQGFYLKVIDYDPQNLPARVGLSKVAEKSGDIEKAYEQLNNALSFAPDDNDVLFNFARLSVDTGKPDKARDALSRLVEIDPSNIMYKKLLGTIYIQDGSLDKAWENMLPYIDNAISLSKWDEARELLDNFREIDPIEVKRRLVTIYKANNDTESALKELREIVSICENNNFTKEALQSCREILQLDPSDESALAKIKELEKDLGIEEPSLEEAPADEFMSEVEAYINQGLVEEATGLLEKLINKEPENIAFHKKLKDVYVQIGDNDKAVGECLRISELCEKSGDTGGKNTVIAEAISLKPDDPRLASIGQDDEIEISTGIEELYPEETTPAGKAAPVQETVSAHTLTEQEFGEKLSEADFYDYQGLKDEALELYRELLGSQPDNEEVRGKLERLQSAAGQEGPAAETTEQASVGDDLKDIFHEFKKGIDSQLGDKDSESRYNLGIAYKEMGLLDDAIKEFKIAAKDSGKTLRSSSMLAICYMEKKLYPLAIQEFKKVVDLVEPTDDGYLGAKCDLGDALVKNKDYNKALGLYLEVQSQDPKFRDVENKVKILKSMASGEKVAGKEKEAEPGADKPKNKKDRVSYI